MQWLRCYCNDFFVVINIFCCSGRCYVQIPFFQFNKIDNIFCIWKLADFKCKSRLDSSLSIGDFKLAIMEIRARIFSWLCSQRYLLYLDISNIQISDVIPPSIWNLSSLFIYLNLSHNQINGEILNNPSILSTSSVIDLSSNHFKGSLPYISSSVIVLDLSVNSFSKSISSFLCFKMNDSKSIGYLNLEKNNLSGKIPDCWMKWNSLVVLNLANNNFSGNFPASIGSLTLLQSLHLYNNKFTGNLPSSLRNCENLVIIDVAKNEFVGSIPSWVGHRFSSLMILNLHSNNFQGHIPKELCALTSLQILDLSHNKLSRGIPGCVKNFSAMATKNNSNPDMSFNHSNYYV